MFRTPWGRRAMSAIVKEAIANPPKPLILPQSTVNLLSFIGGLFAGTVYSIRQREALEQTPRHEEPILKKGY